MVILYYSMRYAESDINIHERISSRKKERKKERQGAKTDRTDKEEKGKKEKWVKTSGRMIIKQKKKRRKKS